MASLIKMHSKEFLKDFIEEYNHKDFIIAVISDQVTVGERKKKKRHNNVHVMKYLIAPSSIWNELLVHDNKKKFCKKYAHYLSMGTPSRLVAVLVKLAIVDGRDVILFTSKDEYKSGMIDVLGKHIEDLYGIDVCTYKEFKKNPEKYDNKKHEKKAIKRLRNIMNDGFTKEYDIALTPKDAKKMLKKMSKEELISTAKQNSIKIKKGMKREEIIDKLLNVY